MADGNCSVLVTNACLVSQRDLALLCFFEGRQDKESDRWGGLARGHIPGEICGDPKL